MHRRGTTQSQSSASATAAVGVSSTASVEPALSDLLATVRSGLQDAYQRGRDGEPVPKSWQAVAALRRYVAAQSPSDLDLVSSRASLLDALRQAYQRGRDGESFEPEPSTAAALQQYLDDHPEAANRASRAIVVVPWTAADATDTDGGSMALFWADGAKMWSAGAMAPGLNEMPFDMTRQSANEPWQIKLVASAI